jgi:hypothetical protein
MEMPKYKLDNLIDTIENDDHLKDFYVIDRERLNKMSYDQYWYFMRLWQNGQYFKIKDLLDKFLNHR